MELKFRVLFEVTNRDFTKSTLKHYTSLERLTNGSDNFDYQAVNVISKDQFTGLKDINGVDIYEGDILHQLDPVMWNPFTVEYSDQSASFIAGGLISRISIRENELVIIGNIHENPELIS